MTLETIIEDRKFQETLDKIRKEEGYDFATIAFYESNEPSSPIKWHHISDNKNNRFKLIILKKGRGLAGTTMKTGKRMVTANVGLVLGPEEKIDYLILLSGSLTAVLTVPLQYRNQVCGMLLSSQRDGHPLPRIFDSNDIRRRFGIFNDDKQ